MTYQRFEDLPVWNDAAQLAADLFEFTRHPAFRGRGALANQMQRAGLSNPALAPILRSGYRPRQSHDLRRGGRVVECGGLLIR